jgi:hypothetical protein
VLRQQYYIISQECETGHDVSSALRTKQRVDGNCHWPKEALLHNRVLLFPPEASVSLNQNVVIGHNFKSVLFFVISHNFHLNIIHPFPTWTFSGSFPRGILTKIVHKLSRLPNPVCMSHPS